jgi:predicted enzyme related to lactoylglutathione lyase
MRRPSIAWGEVTIDCRETERVATFWGALLDTPSQRHGQAGWFRVGPLVSGGPVINFQPVPERKVGKTRIHLDVWTDDLNAAVALVEDLGGRRLSDMGEDPEGVGFVMADPEGNEFCLVALRSQSPA